MKVGCAVIFQNPFNEKSKREVYEHDLRIGDMYERLGFYLERRASFRRPHDVSRRTGVLRTS